MKITLVTNIFPPEIGGPATYAYEILKRLNDRGHKVEVLTLSEGVEATTNVHVVRRHKLKLIGFVQTHLVLLLKVVNVSKDCDVIYTLSPSYTGFFSLIAAKLLRKPIVLRFVGDAAWEGAFRSRQTNKNLEDFLQSPEGDSAVKRLLAIQKYVLNRVNRVIVPSYFLKSILAKHYLVDSEKIKVIYNAFDFGVYNQISSKNLEALSNPKIITVGRLVRHKRIDKIIKTIGKIVKNYPNIKLLIIGDGPERENLEKLSTELEIEENVSFLGKIPHEDVMELIKRFDIFVLNSIYEGLPHVVIEAMACRTPVIATNIRGTNEVVTDGETGLLVSPNNTEELKEKIIPLLRDEGLRKKLVENAYKSVIEKFTWEKNLSILEKELKEVI